VILRGADDGWTFTDRVLAAASILAEDLRCPGCGQSKEEAWNPDSEGYFEAHEATCQGCAEVRRSSEGEKEHHPERKIWVMNTRPPDVQLREWTPA
jgi:hypothetical protein